MPFPMKVQPVESEVIEMASKIDATKPPAISRIKRLFERQFQKPSVAGEWKESGDVFSVDFEPSSVCLNKMVIGFIEEGNSFEKPHWSGCNCFSGHSFDNSSDDDFADAPSLLFSSSGDAADTIKSLVLCTSVIESNLLSDALKIAEKVKNLKEKDDRLRVIAAGLCAIGYNSSLCKSKWEITASSPANFRSIGEHSYIDVIVENGRFILDVDFKSEFEIARSSKSYQAVLQQLPVVFVGPAERLQQIVAVVAEAARQSLKKKGLHVPPWRKFEYMKAKWLSSYKRMTTIDATVGLQEAVSVGGETANGDKGSDDNVLNFNVLTATFSGLEGSCKGGGNIVGTYKYDKFEEKFSVHATPLPWTSPPARPKSGMKVVTGLATVF